jgi:hypothetical protein
MVEGATQHETTFAERLATARSDEGRRLTLSINPA